MAGALTVARVSAVGALLTLVQGCAGLSWAESGRETLAVAARVGAAADAALADAYQDKVADANEEAGGDDDRYREIMAPFDAAVDVLVALRASLLAAQASIDAYEAGERGGFVTAAACIVEAFTRLRDAFAAIGIKPPDELDAILSAPRPSVGFVCKRG